MLTISAPSVQPLLLKPSRDRKALATTTSFVVLHEKQSYLTRTDTLPAGEMPIPTNYCQTAALRPTPLLFIILEHRQEPLVSLSDMTSGSDPSFLPMATTDQQL